MRGMIRGHLFIDRGLSHRIEVALDRLIHSRGTSLHLLQVPMLHRGRIRVKMSGMWSSESGTEIVTGANLIVLTEVAILSGREETFIDTGIAGERLSQNPIRLFFLLLVL